MALATKLNKCLTTKDLLDCATQHLTQHNIEAARRNAEEIYCFCCNTTRLELMLTLHKSTNCATIGQFASLLQERAKHKPLQYILGKSLFFNTELLINESVLIPRPETEELTAIVAKELEQSLCKAPPAITKPKPTIKVLDICAGSGCISLALAQFVSTLPQPAACFDIQFYGIDISAKAVAVANQNKQNLNLNNVNFEHVGLADFAAKRHASQHLSPAPKYDYIICNPPYISLADYNRLAEELFFEPKIALTDGHDGLTFFQQLSASLPDMLADSGKLYLECGLGQANTICGLFAGRHFKATIASDFAGIDRFIIVTTK